MIASTTQGGWKVIAVRVPLDHEFAPGVERELEPLITDGNISRLILNLSQVDFIDPVGMGSLFKVLKWLRRVNATTAKLRLVVVPQSQVATGLLRSDLVRWMPVFGTLEEADAQQAFRLYA